MSRDNCQLCPEIKHCTCHRVIFRDIAGRCPAASLRFLSVVMVGMGRRAGDTKTKFI